MDGDAGLIEPEQHRLGFDTVDPQADDVWQPVDRIAVRVDTGRLPGCLLPRSVLRLAFACSSVSTPGAVNAAAAAPKPMAPTTCSNPALRARSCSPPTMNGSIRSPRRTMRAPMPVGPPNLCEEIDTRSAPSLLMSRGTCPAAATASTWVRMPRPAHRSTTSATGWMVPTSWLAHWQWTMAGIRP